jgi:hypothetical protein
MGHVHRERREVDIPGEAYINHSDGRVYIVDRANHNSRITIGWATSETKFHPNDTFRHLFPNEWEKAFHEYEDPKSYELYAGMYGLCLGAGYASELYPCLVEAYDGLYAAGIMDYCMYSMLEKSNATQLYEERMKEELLFSERVWSDSTWTKFFKDDLKEWQHEKFKDIWLKRCIARGSKNVWVCIDGSNNDCQIENSKYAEHGENKSHSGKTITGFIYAVDAMTGEPLTYFINPGGVVDSQALHEIVQFLVQYGLEVEGVILDRGFCTFEDLQTLRNLDLEYVIMVPATVKGHTLMVKEFGKDIFWKSKFLVDRRGVFGTSGKQQIWGAHPGVTGTLNLFFGAVRGCFGGIDLLDDVLSAKEKAEKDCALGVRPKIEKKFRDIVLIQEDESGLSIVCDYDAWDVSLHHTGFFSMLSSKDFGPKFVYDTYQLRMTSETQYRILKSQEGFDTTRVHSDPGMLSKYAICFAACILRYCIMKACQKNKLDTNVMIQRMDRIRFMINEAGKAVVIRNLSTEAKQLFGEFAMNLESFEEIARDFNDRRQTNIKSEIRSKPIPRQKDVVKPKRGRPPGRKNDKTLEKEAKIAKAKENGTYMEPPARKRGRPPGSKDSKPRKKRSDAGVKKGPRNKKA